MFSLQQVATQDPISPSGRGRHNTGKDGGKGTPAWSESKPSGIDILGGRLADNRHPSVQVHRSVSLTVTPPDLTGFYGAGAPPTWILVETRRALLRTGPTLPSPTPTIRSR